MNVFPHRMASLLLATASVFAISACDAAPPRAADPQAAAGHAAQVVHVHKDANCGCCNGWIAHMRAAGFTVMAHDSADMVAVKQRLGIPLAQASCHTAEVGGYVLEGHVPAADVQRLLREKPAARGLVLPGMPVGSPGMESPDGRRDAFTVALLGKDGALQPYSRHP
ncbi:DUF411 domain-containing protein [Stenotrophomonas sp. MYb238]|uniref:DUF411 domain-containing protein n=1 Tax=Stenotrophomonas sp. MYb238 TaxID=2040281 RepID=UPI00188496FD|nr:DUF411 domain-containing protein [Stenotrophomonas sp. MYb238]